MASRLGTIVTENLHNALAYKTAKHHAIKPEPDLLLAVSENGSNIKVKLDMLSFCSCCSASILASNQEERGVVHE